jgi:hypothetical protein
MLSIQKVLFILMIISISFVILITIFYINETSIEINNIFYKYYINLQFEIKDSSHNIINNGNEIAKIYEYVVNCSTMGEYIYKINKKGLVLFVFRIDCFCKFSQKIIRLI